jgi:hypothetical protein
LNIIFLDSKTLKKTKKETENRKEKQKQKRKPKKRQRPTCAHARARGVRWLPSADLVGV